MVDYRGCELQRRSAGCCLVSILKGQSNPRTSSDNNDDACGSVPDWCGDQCWASAATAWSDGSGRANLHRAGADGLCVDAEHVRPDGLSRAGATAIRPHESGRGLSVFPKAMDKLTQLTINLVFDQSFALLSPYSTERVLFLIDQVYWSDHRELIPPDSRQHPYIHFLLEEGFSSSFFITGKEAGVSNSEQRQERMAALQRFWLKYLRKHNRLQEGDSSAA